MTSICICQFDVLCHPGTNIRQAPPTRSFVFEIPDDMTWNMTVLRDLLKG